MQVNDSTIIDVLNYSDSCVVVSSHIKPDGYLFDPAINGQPFAIQLSFAEIRGINSQSNIFREGFLFFQEDIAKEVYEKLGIKNHDKILTDEDIKEIILTPSKDGLEQIVKIQSSSLFERIRGILIQLENSGQFDISTRVKNVINERYKELYRGKRISEIIIRPTVTETQKEVSKDSNKDEKVAELQNEIQELKEMLMQLTKKDESTKSKTDETTKPPSTKSMERNNK